MIVNWARTLRRFSGLKHHNHFEGDDTLANLNPQRLGQVGEIVNLALITASRQYHY